MANKRRRQPSGDKSDHHSKSKRAKFTLESVHLPELDVEGIVLVTGAGDVGQLGLGPDILEKSRPAAVPLDHKVVDICAGGMHTVCLTKEGKVFTFGCNDEGALGRVTEGKEDAEFEAGEVELPGKVIQISAGDSHTAALLEDGRVFAWGTFRDSHGNMGMTLNGNKKSPYEIIKDVFIKKIASGADHIVFLTNHGDVYTCGCAEQGQLGRTTERGSSRNARSGIGKGQIEKLLKPQPISLKASLRLHFDNIWASNYGTFCKVANSEDMYVFGLNNYNQIGLKELNPYFMPTLSKDFSKYNWDTISSGQHHTIALDVDGKVHAIGRKDYGRLGLGKDCEDAVELKPVDTLEGKKVVNVACGSATSFAVTEEGDLYGWGMGTNGQLGTGEEDDCEIPTLIKSKQLQDKKVFRVSSGGQHTVILAIQRDINGHGDS
ncbi:regulator of chromosome condensation isoform X1 [Diabrotica virgifera virgifera]|uniref:Regulator of chromosome condensation isoform X1 n=1 Tax=Diabrotica virgifera virgifera TaxID=50390 RepID=A0A6P7FFI0_DIAVI|nr:regulator of chromosome condensation isoform X1 [Diabrotica virgifera virgifera]